MRRGDLSLSLEHADRLRDMLIVWAHGHAIRGFLIVVAACAIATSVAAWMVRRFSPHASGMASPHVEAVLHKQMPPAPFGLVPVKFFGGLLAIGSGLALGREGPTASLRTGRPAAGASSCARACARDRWPRSCGGGGGCRPAAVAAKAASTKAWRSLVGTAATSRKRNIRRHLTSIRVMEWCRLDRRALVLQKALQTRIWRRWRSRMPRTVARKEHPLSMRLPESDIAIIDRAAALRGRSRTDFVRDAAVRAAEEVLMETAPIRMSPAGFKAFMAALSGPATAVPEMIELFQRTAPWEKSDSETED
jgi:uncharacterized protein (DUF1778 family)